MCKVEIEEKIEFFVKCEQYQKNRKMELLDKCASLIVFAIEIELFVLT